MAVIAPQTDVYLLKVPLEIDDINQLTFSSTTAQHNYFNSLPKIGVDNFTYQRKDGTIRYGANFDSLVEFNYVMYRNDAYSNKWFYAFITGMEYLNDNVTAISIKTDVFQTWQFNLDYKRTFIEREHVNNDGIGVNTIDEGLEVGEYMENGLTSLYPNKTITDASGNAISGVLANPVFFQVSELASGISIADSMFDTAYNQVFSGLKYFAVTSYANARAIIKRYDDDGKGDAIISIFIAPKQFLAGANVFGELGYNIYIPKNTGLPYYLLDTTTVNRPTTVNGYTPTNKKLFTYPFSYMYVTNNAGTDATFRYEDFANATPKFQIIGALGQGCATKLLPYNYKGDSSAVYEFGVTGAKYPVCAWASDYYTNWVTQNAVNLNVGVATSALSAGVNAGYGNYVGAASSLLSGIGGVMAQVHAAKVQPDQAKGNANTSDLLPSTSKYFSVVKMSVRAEVARCIDNFFDMFGYKVNRVKVPNITGRRNWNYVKTIGCYIEADIPQDDLKEIKDMFDKGITLWHHASTFADYSQPNDII